MSKAIESGRLAEAWVAAVQALARLQEEAVPSRQDQARWEVADQLHHLAAALEAVPSDSLASQLRGLPPGAYWGLAYPARSSTR